MAIHIVFHDALHEEILMNNSVRRITDGAMMIAIVGAVLLIDRQLGNILTGYFMFLLPLPMVFYSTKYGMKDSWVVFVAMVLISFIVSTPSTIFYIASESFLGMVYGGGTHKHMQPRRLVMLCMLVGIVVNLIDTLVISAMLGYDLITQVNETTALYNEYFSQLIGQMPENFDFAGMVRNVILLVAAITGILQGYVTHVLSRLLLKRLRFQVEPVTPISSYYPPKWSAILALAGVIFYFITMANPYENEILQNVLQTAGMTGYLYLAFYGVIAVVVLAAARGVQRGRFLIVLLAFFLMMTMPMVMVMLGYLYIATDMHQRLMNGGVSGNAEKDG